MRKQTRRRRGDLLVAAGKLARLLGPDECLLVGGLAVGIHGYVRATDDLDFVSRLSFSETRERLRRAGIATRVLSGDPFEGGFSCLKGEIDGIPFDVLPPLVPLAWDAAPRLELAHHEVRVVDLDGLLRLKFRAGGPQDLLDAAQLVLRHPGKEAQARELATAYRERDRFDKWLSDPRIRVQASDAERRERATRRRAGTRAKGGPRRLRRGSAARGKRSKPGRSDGKR